MDAGDAPTKNPKVLFSELAHGEAVLLHLDSGAYHELNPIGAAIWNLLDGQRSLSHVVQELRAQIEDPPAELEEVVASYLEQLRERDLIR